MWFGGRPDVLFVQFDSRNVCCLFQDVCLFQLALLCKLRILFAFYSDPNRRDSLNRPRHTNTLH